MNVIRAGLLFLFAFSVLAFGSVEVWAASILEIGASVLFVAWAAIAFAQPDFKVEWNLLNWPLLGWVAIGAAQLALHVSPYPLLTREQLLKLAAYCLLFFLSTQVFRQRRDLFKLIWFLIILCFSVSLIGIIQFFAGSETTIYGFRTLTGGGIPFGPFVNRNHFAGFVELTLPVGLALMIFRGLRRDLFPLAALLTVVPVGAIMLSGSRGGIVGFAFEVAILALLARYRRGPQGARLAALGIVGLATLALVAWLGAGKVLERFSGLRAGDVTLSKRATMVHGGMHIFFDHPVAGVGIGSLVAVYPRYETLYDGKIVDHVHNDYVELLAETGILGAACGLAFLWLLFSQARKCYVAEQGHFSRAVHAAAIAAVCGLLLHSFVDFNLHIPSNALLFLVLVHLATTTPLPSEVPAVRQRKRMHDDLELAY
jgi:O-antigen ligase